MRLAVGTDAPLVPFGTGYHDELAHFREAGFTPAEILHFATVNNAAYLGASDSLGQIAPGFLADLLLLGANPLQDINAVRSPALVLLDGQIVVR